LPISWLPEPDPDIREPPVSMWSRSFVLKWLKRYLDTDSGQFSKKSLSYPKIPVTQIYVGDNSFLIFIIIFSRSQPLLFSQLSKHQPNTIALLLPHPRWRDSNQSFNAWTRPLWTCVCASSPGMTCRPHSGRRGAIIFLQNLTDRMLYPSCGKRGAMIFLQKPDRPHAIPFLWQAGSHDIFAKT
jgi:hypothetical protein